MADMDRFGAMDVNDRGGVHDHQYPDTGNIPATPGLTPSQTIGPFFAYGLTPGPYGYANTELFTTDLAACEVAGTRISIEGQVFDAAGQPVHDAMIEIVQADASGRYADAPRNDGFTGFGRCGTGANGPAEVGGDTRFVFQTIKPGPTQEGAAPFISVIVFMRGLLNHCITRLYFPEDDLTTDPVLSQVPELRRKTLVATELSPGRYEFEIQMQGANETVFFDI